LKNPIFVLIGPVQSGKSTLILEVVRKLPDKLEIVKSVTTRPKREDEDDLFYDFMDFESYIEKKLCMQFIETVSYGGNYYGYLHSSVDKVIKEKAGICAATEQGVLELQRSEYNVVPIKIIAKHNEEVQRDFYEKNPKRLEDDRRREEVAISFKKQVVNSFKGGGKEKATQDLVLLIQKMINTKAGI